MDESPGPMLMGWLDGTVVAWLASVQELAASGMTQITCLVHQTGPSCSVSFRLVPGPAAVAVAHPGAQARQDTVRGTAQLGGRND
jgi:hypothetical protein